MGVPATILLLVCAVGARADQTQTVEQAGLELEVLAATIERHPNGMLESAQLAADAIVAGVPVEGAPERVGFFASGRLRWGALSASAELDGFRAAAGTRFELFDRDPDDTRRSRLRHATLDGAQALEGIRLPGGTTFYRNSHGRILQAYLPARARIHGVLVGGPGTKAREVQFFKSEPKLSAVALGDQGFKGVPIPDGSRVYFDSSGRLRALDPTRPIVLHGLTFEREIQFDPSGTVREAWLAPDQSVAGLPCSGRHPIQFHPNARVARCRVTDGAGQARVGPLLLAPGSRLDVHPNGKLASAYLQGPHLIQGLRLVSRDETSQVCRRSVGCRSDRPISWYPNGKLESGLLFGAQTLRGMRLAGVEQGRDPGDGCYELRLWQNGAPERVYLAGDQVVAGLPLAARRPDGTCCPVTFDRAGKLSSACLAERHRIGRVSLLEGTPFRLHPNGRLAAGILAGQWKSSGVTLLPFVPISLRASGRLVADRAREGFRVGRLVIPPGSLLLSDRQQRVEAIVLAGDVSFNRLTAREGDALLLDASGGLTALVLAEQREVQAAIFPAHSELTFDSFGVVGRVRLINPARIQGIPCAANEPLLLHPSGRIERARLAEPIELGGRRFAPGEILELYADGRPVMGSLTRAVRIGGRDLAPGDLVEQVYPDGALRVAVFATDRDIDGKPCRAGVETHFHGNGRLKRCWLARPVRVQGLLVRDQIELSATGRLERAFLAQAHTLAGVELAADAIALYADGRIRWGRLSKEQTIGSKTYPALSLIRFDHAGEVQRAEPFAPPVGF